MTAKAALVPSWPSLPIELDLLIVDINAETENDARHPRPWDLATLPAKLQETTWEWLDAAVRWMNLCGGWQPTAVVPPCWRRHPHLAVELAVLAFERELAVRTTVPDHLREWHVHLHAFQARMAQALGDTGLKDCQRGRHGDRPSAYELEQYMAHHSSTAADASQLSTDSGPDPDGGVSRAEDRKPHPPRRTT